MKRTKWLIGAGALLAVAAVGIKVVGEPALVRFPLNVDQTLRYTGTATVYVNPTTGARLPTPLKTPLTVDRQIKVVSGDFSHAVVTETDKIAFAGQTQTTKYQYYMNRRTMQLVNGPKSYAFDNPASLMTTGGSYRINFPLDTKVGTYDAWAPETNSVATATSVGKSHHDPVSGDQVITFNTTLDHAVAPYYLDFLKSMGMPMSLSAASMASQLQASGVSISQVMADVGPHLTAAQMVTLTKALAQPVPLNYSYFQRGQIQVQTSTGAVVGANVSREGVAVTPVLSGTAPAVAILAPYANLPSVQALSRAVTSLSQTQTALSMSYNETLPSIKSAVSTANDLGARADLVQWKLPIGIGAAAVVVLLIAAVWRPRPHPGATPTQVEFETKRGKEAA
ncbi:MAG TPA: porin PorA family protein [Acidimicrobiales bacterium]|nr:porin PorA family protein [Acidimicrobiales bacterium]